MSVTRNEKPSSAAPSRTGEGAPVTRPVFNFDAVIDAEPELEILGAGRKVESQVKVECGADLSGKKKIIFWTGRGKTGKTTGIRWAAEAAVANGRSLLMADMDPTNDTFSKYFGGVLRPPEASEPAIALKWLDKLLQHALQQGMSLLVDLGGGDTTLRRLVTQLPDLVAMFEAQGFAVIMLYAIGPQEEDLSPLATLQSLGLRPTATAIVLNEAMIEVGDTRESAFARVFGHSAFRAAVDRGAVPVWMPRLLAAQQVEIRRLHFRDAADGQVGQGTSPLGPFDRSRVLNWLQAMDANFAGIKTWFP